MISINVDNSLNTPIYEQIKQQIITAIVNKKLIAGQQLPSIRQLARELRIGVITSKRVYDDLTTEGYLISYPGKGVFVSKMDISQIKMNKYDEIKVELSKIVGKSKNIKLEKERLIEMLEELYEEDKE